MDDLIPTKKSIFRRGPKWWSSAWFWVVGIILIVCMIWLGVGIISNFNNVKKENRTQTSGIITEESRYWLQDQDGWKPVGNPPNCPSPLTLSIADISSATSVLYPGQMRSIGYEPTAGFRYDKSTNNSIVVKAPLDGEIIQAARYYEQGQIQYTVDVLSSCGIMNRFDHILKLPQNLELMTEKLPPAKESDTRSSNIDPPIKVKQGEIVAEAVGSANNVYISWTVFDFRNKNASSQNPAWAEEKPVLYHYAICPFEFMSAEDQKKIASLPAADSTSGSKSDFCKK